MKAFVAPNTERSRLPKPTVPQITAEATAFRVCELVLIWRGI